MSAVDQLAQNVATFFAVLTAFFAWAFVARYSRRAWRTYQEGRLIMTLASVVALFLSIAVLNRLAPDSWHVFILVVFVLLYAALAGVMGWLNVLLSHAIRYATPSKET